MIQSLSLNHQKKLNGGLLWKCHDIALEDMSVLGLE